MPRDLLHNHPEFADLIRIVAEEKGIDPALVEKDYWIMHCLCGLQELGFTFQLKGGTSLSKGHKIIGRFSEDIDILIAPFPGQDVKIGKNQNSAAQIKTRTDYRPRASPAFPRLSPSVPGHLELRAQRDGRAEDDGGVCFRTRIRSCRCRDAGPESSRS
jgi:hypothetical protein